jgi:L-ascorbate metabolism protein UlaG (beta-lactamase superfamily)
MADVSLTWLGHASFRLDTAGGKRIYVDPFLNGNPKCPEAEQTPERVDVIAITHGHGDHLGDTVDLASKHGCTVVAPVELADWLQIKHKLDDVRDPNKGGTVDVDGVRFTFTDANHSSSNDDLAYMGEPCGIVIRTDGKSIYFAGDTNVFGDMQTVIARLYKPDVAVLPIGDHYTMGPEEAALAVELLGVKRVVPCHWGTFPALTGTPEALADKVGGDVTVERIEPGDTVII